MKNITKGFIVGAIALASFGIGTTIGGTETVTETETVVEEVIIPDPKQNCLYAVITNDEPSDEVLPECEDISEEDRLELGIEIVEYHTRDFDWE